LKALLLVTSKVFFFMPVTAKPLRFMSDGILLRNMHRAELAKHHVTLFYFTSGVFFVVFLALTGLKVLDYTPQHPDYQSENNESDQAHKKSLY
jgi:hypothetical protein